MYSANSPGATVDGGRNEKLLAARKKLKQFQNRRRSTSRNDNSGRSHGNDENRGEIEDGTRLHRSRHRQSGDEGEADDRPLSECYPGYSTESLAESTASTTKATKASRANRRASAASSRYLETPEPIRVAIAPEQQQEILRQQQERQQGPVAFYHDEQRSPFQRVKRESESSEATLQPIQQSKPIDPRSQHVSLTNEFSLGSSSSADSYQQQHHTEETLRYPASGYENSGTSFTNASSAVGLSDISPKSGAHSGDTEQFVLNMDETTSVPQMSSGNEYRPGESLLQYSIAGAPVVETVTVKSQEMPARTSQIMPQTIPSTYAHVASGTEDQYVQNSSLQATVQQQQAVIEQLTAQLQQLNSHYAQLHTAYSDLVRQQQAPATATDESRETDELRRQVQLHLHTMSVLVDEKTDLQSQLRQAMEIANQKHVENEELQGRLKANRERLTLVETELESHAGSYRNLEDTLKRQAAELERLRKESAQWQARATEAQQDRSEMNAKLKVRSREVDDLGAKLKESEKQLHLKEIYIQQITGGPGALQQQQALGEELEQQKRANVELYAQLENAKKAIEQWRWESEQSRERYEAYVKQLNEGATGLSQRLELAEREKYNLQLRCEQLEKQLSAFNANEKGEEGARPTTEDLESLKVILNEFEQGLKTANDRAADLEQRLVEKETVVKTLTEQLGERDRLVRQMNEQLNEKYQHDDSAKSLLEQLHNEKATVSRAVAQNIELKKQLVELQEKFVSMSESSMATADKLESAERQLASFKENQDHKDDSTKSLLEKREQEIVTLREQLNSLSSQNFERSHLEDRLRHYEAVQKHFDFELERSLREISHLKVENADLTQRMAILSDANKNLQMERQRSTQLLSDQTNENNGAEEVTKLRAALAESENSVRTLTQQVETLKNQDNVEEIKRQLASYEQELADSRRRLQHLGTENAELHRIMEQNAEDENQNTIRVELNQALNRSTALANDNDRLRQRVQELEVALAQERSTKSFDERSSAAPGETEYREESCQSQAEHVHGTCPHSSIRSHENNGDDRSSVCSEHIEQRREATNSEAVENMKAAMEQLQQRFAKAMNENADLSDQNQQLEHLITQLQSETETIGEYITIYQHQRRTIRERLREKEEYVAKLAKEKEDVQAKLTELQQLVVRMLRDRGSLRQYPQAKPVYGKPPPSTPSVAPRKPRGLSQTLVDEVAGAEVPLVVADGLEALSPSVIPDAPVDPVQSNGEASPAISEDLNVRSVSPNHVDLVVEAEQHQHIENSNEPGSEALPDLGEEDATAERILRLLTEMRRPDLVNSLPPVDRSLHCKYCTGRLIML